MSCFWDALIQELRAKRAMTNPMNPKVLAELLKKNNVQTLNVRWQDEKLSSKQLQENFHHVKIYDSDSVNSGYWCSTFDPFLFLTCELFKVHISHIYLTTRIEYKYISHESCPVIPTLQFRSSSSHFSIA